MGERGAVSDEARFFPISSSQPDVSMEVVRLSSRPVAMQMGIGWFIPTITQPKPGQLNLQEGFPSLLISHMRHDLFPFS